jgi:hypothetical protein
MKRPDPMFLWRGIQFDWTQSANAYIVDTIRGRWTVQRHANDDSQWFARFGPYAGQWCSSPELALNSVWAIALNAHTAAIEYLKSLS